MIDWMVGRHDREVSPKRRRQDAFGELRKVAAGDQGGVPVGLDLIRESRT
jgi:hypothetical protein